jgi:hypothetical protein
MVQLKVLKRYDDKVLGKRVKEGTVLEVTVERAKELLQAEKAKPSTFNFKVIHIDKIE